MPTMLDCLRRATFAGALSLGFAALAFAQSVCLPAPRLLTTMPMGGKVGTEIEVTISGEHLAEAGELMLLGSADHRDTETRRGREHPPLEIHREHRRGLPGWRL